MLRRAFNTFLIPKYAAQVNDTILNTVKTEKWDLFAGVFVERLPIITKTLTPLEKEYQEHLAQIEFEQSLKSDFELREEKDKLIAELQKKGKIDVDLEAAQLTAQDYKDQWKDELSKYKLSSRITEADKKNDRKSINRELENPLILVVEQKLGNGKHFVLPQGQRQGAETMRQCAERVLKEQCGDQLNVQFYGNAPCGFYKYKYPASQRNNAVGVKLFFFRSAYRSGTIDAKQMPKYEWLTGADLENKLKRSYFDSISQFMI